MDDASMIYPRSPLEKMQGWMHLPRLIDKIRLNQAGRLDAGYRENLLKKGFDRRWLEVAGVDAGQLVEVVAKSITDGEVCDWVAANARCSAREKQEFNEFLANHGREGNELRERLSQRKKEAGMDGREDIQCSVDFIDADEGRI
jgi:hypothetical protein